MEEEEPMPDEADIVNYTVDPIYLEELMYRCGAMKLLCPELADHDYAHHEQISKNKKVLSTGNDEERVASGDIPLTHEPPALEMVDKPRIDQTPIMPRMEHNPAPTFSFAGQRTVVSRGPPPSGDRLSRPFQPVLLHSSHIQSPQKPTAAVRMADAAPVVLVRRPDPPPHRMVDKGPAGPSIPKMKGYNSPLEHASQQIMGNGHAPTFVGSRGVKNVKRGNSHGKKDDIKAEGEQIPPPTVSTPHLSVRKVHFPGETMHMLPRAHEDQRFHHEPIGVPHPATLRPHTGASIRSPMRNALPPRAPQVVETAPAHVPHTAIQHEDPNPLPDSIIDDTPEPAPPTVAKVREESDFPSHLAEIVMNMMPDPQQAPEEPTDASIKEKISRIANELKESEKSRPGRTVSTSSMSSTGMPPQNVRRTNDFSPPPVRTNLDFNSHLKPNAALSTPRGGRHGVAAHSIPHKELQKLPPKVQVVAKKDSPKKRGRPNNKKLLVQSSDDDEDEEEIGKGEWDDDEVWTTRCICGFEDDFEGMVECEGCSVWQHFVCLDIPANADTAYTKGWLCEVCDPGKKLPFTPEEASRRMRKLLKKPPLKQSAASKKMPSPAPVKKPQIPDVKTPAGRKSSELPSAKNTYTKLAKHLLAVCGHGGSFTGKEAVNAYEKMMVAQGVEGLVATKDISDGVAVVEIVGNVCIPHEAGADANSFFNQFVFVYDGFGDTKGASRDSLCVDARKQSSDGRFVRRCCRPNASIQHKFNNGIVTFFVVTSERITKGAEITIPFDFGYRPMRNTAWCRCAKTDDLSSCLLSNHTFAGPGHRPVAKTPVPKTPVPKTPVPKTPTEPTRKVSRSKNDESSNNNLPVATPTAKVSREEKSEEESAVVARKEAETPNTRKRGKTVGAKRGSDKEELPKAKDSDVVEKKHRKDSISEKRAQDLQKTADAVNFVIHNENTMSREERKLAAIMSRFGPQNEANANQKKKEAKKEEPKAQSEKRKGRTVATADVRKRRNTDSVGNDDPVTPRAASPTAKKMRHDSERSTMPAKKGWIARHEAQSSEKSSSSDGQPSPKKNMDAGENEVANVLAEMHNGSNVNLRDDMRKSAVDLQLKLKEEEFQLPQDMQSMMKDHKQRMMAQERTQERAKGTPQERAKEVPKERLAREKVVEKKEQPKERIPALPPTKPSSTAQVAEPPKEVKPAVRRLSYEEYKKRKATDPASTEELKPPSRTGFIPEMTEDDLMPTLPPIQLPRDDKPVPHSGPPSTPRTATRSSTRNVPPPPPPRPVAATSVERPAPVLATPPAGERMSIADRLAVEFGIGALPSPKKSDPR